MLGVHKLYWSALNTLTFLLSPISWLSPVIAPFMFTFLMLLQPGDDADGDDGDDDADGDARGKGGECKRLCKKVAKHI